MLELQEFRKNENISVTMVCRLGEMDEVKDLLREKNEEVKASIEVVKQYQQALIQQSWIIFGISVALFIISTIVWIVIYKVRNNKVANKVEKNRY